MKNRIKKITSILLTTLVLFNGCQKEDKNNIPSEYKDKYDFISDIFEGPNGFQYTKVSTKEDFGFVEGWFNVSTQKEDVPTNKFVSFTKSNNPNIYYAIDSEGDVLKVTFDCNGVSFDRIIEGRGYSYMCEESFNVNGVEHKRVSRKDNNGCEMGWLNMETYKEDIKCKKYDFIDINYTLIGDVNYVQVSVPNDDGYAYGYINLQTFEEEIPCATYKYIDTKSDDKYILCTEKNGEVQKIKKLFL